MKIGVLGLQGDVREHLRSCEVAGATPVVVTRPEQISSVDGLIIPGGESTTMGKLLHRFELLQPLRQAVAGGLPLYGTCAGMILMAARVAGEKDAPGRLGVMDIVVTRNAYGRQIDSFEADIDVEGFDRSLRAVFIRAPAVESVAMGVEVLARCDGRPVLVRQENMLASSFHPEMSGDPRVHELFVGMVSH